MEIRELKNQVWMQGNEINFFTEFNTVTVNELIRLVQKGKAKKNLVINLKSYGGAGDEMWAAIDLVQKYDIGVHIIGYAMSAGAALFAASKRRSMERNAKLMFHQSSYGMRGTVEDHRRQLKVIEFEEEVYRNLIVATGAFTQEEVEAHDLRNEDWYIFYDEALERGLINKTTEQMQSDELKIEKVEIVEEEGE